MRIPDPVKIGWTDFSTDTAAESPTCVKYIYFCEVWQNPEGLKFTEI